jgi:hypothetical protein
MKQIAHSFDLNGVKQPRLSFAPQMSKRSPVESDSLDATSKDRKVTLTDESIRIRYGLAATRTPDTSLAADYDARFLNWRASSRKLIASNHSDQGSDFDKTLALEPCALATLWFGAEDESVPNVICPITQLHESLRASCPWVWAASLDAWIDANFGRLNNSAALCAMLKRELRDAIVIQTAGDSACWLMAYVLRARADGVEPAEPFWHGVGERTVHAVAFGTAPASEAAVDAAASRLKARLDWTFDPTLVQFWRLLHERFFPVRAARDGVYSAQDIGIEEATLAPGRVKLKANIDPDVFEDIEVARPEDIQLLQDDTGRGFYVMWRTDKETNRQIVVNWDHEQPGEELVDERERSFIDWLRMGAFNE